MTKYTNIIEQLSDLGKSDPGKINATIKCLLFAPDTACVKRSDFNGMWCIFDGVDRNGRARLIGRPSDIPHTEWIADKYLSSVDACIALKERVLPEYDMAIQASAIPMPDVEPRYSAYLSQNLSAETFTGTSNASLTISILIALFLALEAKETV